MQNQRMHFLDMNWIWEINLAKVQIRDTKTFDYFIRGKDEPIVWTERPGKIMDGDHRAIGALTIDYIAKIGIDLKQVLVHFDRSRNLVEYWLPDPQITGALNPDPRWNIKTVLRYSRGEQFANVRRDWHWFDEESKNTALPIWEQETTAALRTAFASRALKDQLGKALKNEAERRLRTFFEMLLHCKAKAVQRGQLEKPDTLGSLLPAIIREQSLYSKGKEGVS